MLFLIFLVIWKDFEEMVRINIDHRFPRFFFCFFISLMFRNKKEKEIGNVTLKYLSLSWQASTNTLPTCFSCSFLLLLFFFFFFLVMEKVFLLWHNGMIIFCVGEIGNVTTRYLSLS